MPDGNRVFYDRLLGPISSSLPDAEEKIVLNRLERMTPGDFKVVRDRFAFYPNGSVTPAMLVEALKQEAEVKTKHKGNNQIGF